MKLLLFLLSGLFLCSGARNSHRSSISSPFIEFQQFSTEMTPRGRDDLIKLTPDLLKTIEKYDIWIVNIHASHTKAEFQSNPTIGFQRFRIIKNYMLANGINDSLVNIAFTDTEYVCDSIPRGCSKTGLYITVAAR